VKIDLLDTAIASAVIHRNIAMSAGVNIKTLPISDVIHTIPTGEEGAWQLTRTESGAVELYSLCLGSVGEGRHSRGTEGGGLRHPEKVQAQGHQLRLSLRCSTSSGLTLKMGYNAGESVFDAAQRFI